MLVIISDLHLTDGTTGKTITADAFSSFIQFLKNTAYSASWRADETYKPIDEIDVVMLGDVLDFIRSSRWFDEKPGDADYTRPWFSSQSPAFIRKIDTITDGILAHNERALEYLRDDMKYGMRIPPATQGGLPNLRADSEHEIKINLYYMIGNHDWFLRLPGAAYNGIRQKIINAMGLSQNAEQPFPHEPSESKKIQDVFGRHKVYARHGDIYDSFNYDKSKGRSASSLGDATTIDLVGRFPNAVGELLGDQIPDTLIEDLKEIENIRPPLLAPVWINGMIRRYFPNAQDQQRVQNIWNHTVEEFLDLPFVRAHDDWYNPFDKVDMLESVLRITKDTSWKTISDLVTWVKQKFWGGNLTFARHALEEEAFKTRAAHYIVYGHVHHHEIVPLDTSLVEGEYFNQFYINSGTWRAFHELTIKNPRDQKFVPNKSITYLTFYQEDERSGRPFEAWQGVLSYPTHLRSARPRGNR